MRHAPPRDRGTLGDAPRALMLGLHWIPEGNSGLDRYVHDLFVALTDRGSSPAAVVLGEPGDEPRVYGAGSGRLMWRLLAYRRVAAAACLDVNLVDSHFALAAFAALTVRRVRRLPLVVHFHGPWAAESMSTRRSGRASAFVKRQIEKFVYRRADRLVTLSGAFAEKLAHDYGVPRWRIEIVRPGVDLVRFRPGDMIAARARLGIGEDDKVALTVRRLVPRTGVGLLLQSWRSVVAAQPRSVLLVAGDGPERRALESDCATLGLKDHVRFLGRVSDEDLVACYQAADVSVVPSVELEGFGMVVGESLACGTPVVVSDSGGLPEAVRRLNGSLVVPAGDVGALARALVGAFGGQEHLPTRDACRRAAESDSWSGVADRHLSMYRDVIGPSRQRRLRVVFLVHTAVLSGAELALVRFLGALKISSHVIIGGEGPLVRRLEQAGAAVEVLPLGRYMGGVRRADVRPGKLDPRSGVSTIWYVIKLSVRLRQLRPDLVHTNSLKSSLYGGLAARLAGVPCVWHVHDRIAPDYLPGGAVRLVRIAASVLPSGVIADSNATLHTLGALRRPASVVYEPLDPALLGEAPVPIRTPPDPLRVGIVGRLAPWKGQLVFIDAFARAFPAPSAVIAVLVGAALFGENDYEEQIRAHALASGLAERVDFRGFRADVAAELARLDILVHASTVPEPFGAVIVEGMAAGLPVVASAAGGPKEIITHDHDGLLVPPGDVEALAAILKGLAEDPQWRARLGAAGRVRARDFLPDRLSPGIEAVYERVLASRRRRRG